MQEIIITPTEKIYSDNLNYVFAVKRKKPMMCFGKSYHWKDKWYYPSLKACYNDLLDYYAMTKHKATIKENLEEAVKLLAELKIKTESDKHPEK